MAQLMMPERPAVTSLSMSVEGAGGTLEEDGSLPRSASVGIYGPSLLDPSPSSANGGLGQLRSWCSSASSAGIQCTSPCSVPEAW